MAKNYNFIIFHFKVTLSCVLLIVTFANVNAKAVPDAKPKPVNGNYAPAPIPVGPASAALVTGPAKPYSYAYEVIDPAGGNAYGHRESSDGVVVEGEYRVVLPDTRTQIVTYKVTPETGYVAEVRYEGTPVFDGIAAGPASERLTKQPSGRQGKRIDANLTPQNQQSIPAFFTA